MRRWLIGLLTASGFWFGIAASASAATASGSIAVSATVTKACLVTSLPLGFGNYDPTATGNNDASTTFTVLCTLGTSYQIGLDAGSGAGATVTNRIMTSGSNTLNYGLYQTAGRTTNWGNTPGTDTPAAFIAGLLPATWTVYGRIAPGQNVNSGLYQDTVNITVTY